MTRLLNPLDSNRDPCRTGELQRTGIDRVPCEAAKTATAIHPGRESKPDEILAHAIAVHHRRLRDQLLWIGSLLEIVFQSGNRSCEGNRALRARLRTLSMDPWAAAPRPFALTRRLKEPAASGTLR